MVVVQSGMQPARKRKAFDAFEETYVWLHEEVDAHDDFVNRGLRPHKAAIAKMGERLRLRHMDWRAFWAVVFLEVVLFSFPPPDTSSFDTHPHTPSRTPLPPLSTKANVNEDMLTAIHFGATPEGGCDVRVEKEKPSVRTSVRTHHFHIATATSLHTLTPRC